jgi:hypothetical protein
MSMQIQNLQTAPHLIPKLAAWHHAEWSYLNPGNTLEKRIEKMQDYLNADLIPSTFIANHNEELLGSAAIILKKSVELNPAV